MKKSALILIDLQNDFMPSGALSISDSNEVIALANQIMPQFDFVVATKNWYPSNHICFTEPPADNQEKCPVHCVQNTTGAELSSELDTSGIHHILPKGTHTDIHSYSAFFDHDPYHATGLHTLLKFHKIKKIYLLGLSVNQSVEKTALDAVHLGYQVYLLLDGCRSLNKKTSEEISDYFKKTDTKVKLIHSTDLHAIPEQLAFAFYDEQ